MIVIGCKVATGQPRRSAFGAEGASIGNKQDGHGNVWDIVLDVRTCSGGSGLRLDAPNIAEMCRLTDAIAASPGHHWAILTPSYDVRTRTSEVVPSVIGVWDDHLQGCWGTIYRRSRNRDGGREKVGEVPAHDRTRQSDRGITPVSSNGRRDGAVIGPASRWSTRLIRKAR